MGNDGAEDNDTSSDADTDAGTDTDADTDTDTLCTGPALDYGPSKMTGFLNTNGVMERFYEYTYSSNGVKTRVFDVTAIALRALARF